MRPTIAYMRRRRIPPKRANNTEHVSIWWRHNEQIAWSTIWNKKISLHVYRLKSLCPHSLYICIYIYMLVCRYVLLLGNLWHGRENVAYVTEWQTTTCHPHTPNQQSDEIKDCNFKYICIDIYFGIYSSYNLLLALWCNQKVTVRRQEIYYIYHVRVMYWHT